MYECCPLKENKKCGFCAYDKDKELRCGFATSNNYIKYLSECPLKNVKKRRRKR